MRNDRLSSMDASETHLRHALEDCNNAVEELQGKKESPELLGAYARRASVLAMMGYRTSALDDIESAKELSETMGEPEPSVMFRIYVTEAILLYEQDTDPIESYYNASAYLSKVNEDDAFYDQRSLLNACITAISDLLNYGHAEDTGPFIEKAYGLCMSFNNPWIMNRKLEVCNLDGEVCEEMGVLPGAIDAYGRAVQLGMELLSMGSLEDEEELVSALISKGNCEQEDEDPASALTDFRSAALIMEQMLDNHRLDDIEILSDVYRNIASILISQGREEEGESYLIKSMKSELRMNDS